MRDMVNARFKSVVGCLIFVSLLAFSMFPGKGHLEGDQRTLTLENRSDHWGALTAILYGQWPNFFENWRFTLVLFQLFSLWAGFFFIFRKVNECTKFVLTARFILIYVSTVFASQLARDASLFAFSILGFGLLYESKNRRRYLRIILLALGLSLLFTSAMFKPLYGLIVGVFASSIVLSFSKSRHHTVMLSFLLVTAFAIGPYTLDKQLGRNIGLESAFPEKQPIIFDLASSYCWGSSPNIKKDAARSLEPILRNSYPINSICASLTPTTWDSLHAYPIPWEYSQPIIPPYGSKDSEIMNSLQQSWMNLIRNNFVDWIQVKSIFLGPALLMTNTLTHNLEPQFSNNILNVINSSFYEVLVLPYRILDKARLTSLGFALLFFHLFLIIQLWKPRVLQSNSSHYYRITIFCIFLIWMVLAITLVGFVASNGRYVLPYLLFSYTLQLRYLSLNQKSEPSKAIRKI